VTLVTCPPNPHYHDRFGKASNSVFTLDAADAHSEYSDMASHPQSIIVTATFVEPSITITDSFPANKQVKTTIKALSGKLVNHLNKKDGYDLELKGRADISYHGSYPVTGTQPEPVSRTSLTFILVQENAETKLSELHTQRLELVFRPRSHTSPSKSIHARHKSKDEHIAVLKEKAGNQSDEFEEMKKTLKELQIGLKKQANELAKHKTDMGARIQRVCYYYLLYNYHRLNCCSWSAPYFLFRYNLS